ncbi:MAG TPA: hypothetical protein VEU32_10340 [Burkholderiales bacterium]|nr:hypothetical protein [Burkholderiales bacterium]
MSWRLPFLVLGFISLVFGVAGGLARLSPIDVSLNAVAFHGALMVSAFFGTVISLERAVALARPWAYLAPLSAGVGGIYLILGRPDEGFQAMTLAAAVLVVASIAILRRQRSVEMATLGAGAVAWLVGNASVLVGLAAVPWWIAFFALTIGAERLELSRYLKRTRFARDSFVALAVGMILMPPFPRLLGLVLVLLALWLFAFDLARVTVRQARLTRYVAVCLLAGYFWLALGGLLMALSIDYEAALHTIFVGFVFSMVFGHAPIIVPAVLRVSFRYHPALYAPLILLHGSLALRLFWVQAGAWGNAAAIVLFIATALFLVLRVDSHQSANSTPR